LHQNYVRNCAPDFVNLEAQDEPISTLASFVVERGRGGAQRA
jgi:hypothetical protein